MPNRSSDWFARAERNLEQASSSRDEERHEWACFAAQQAAELAVKAHRSRITVRSGARRRSRMPVRSLRSSVMKWPGKDEVHAAIRRWAIEANQRRDDVIGIGYFGSYARDEAGPGSDLDIVVVVETDDRPFDRRNARWRTSSLPVPVDLLVYTRDEYERIVAEQTRFASVLTGETRWIVDQGLPQR